MGVTSKLLKLYRVDQQLLGLKSKLRAAERYFNQQTVLLEELDRKLEALMAQARQLEATAHNDETEIKGLDGRIEMLRERMNNAATSREHSALLTEINTLKADRGLIEERGLESMQKVEEIRERIAEIEREREERAKVRAVADADRTQRAEDISDRVAEFEAQRQEVVKDVPPSALGVYQERLELGLDIDEVMAPVEEQDRRNREYSCGGCYTHLPVEQVNVLLNRGDLQTCSSCDAILYMPEDLRESLTEAADKKRRRRAAEAVDG